MPDAPVVVVTPDQADPIIPIGALPDLGVSLDSPQETDVAVTDPAAAVTDPAAASAITDPAKVAAAQPTVEELQKQLAATRKISRDQRLQIAGQQDEINQIKQRLSQKPAAIPAKQPTGLDDFEDEAPAAVVQPKVEEIQPTVFQQLQNSLQHITNTKGSMLETLAETMALNAAYTDLYDVVSKSNFADIVDTIAEDLSAEHKISMAEAQLRTEVAIWSKPNPYKYMYEVIKKYHPSYAQPADPAKAAIAATPGKVSPAQAAASAKTKQPVEAPGSIQNLPAGSDLTTGWTAARIDAMDEDELGKVPGDIYETYLKGQLK